MKKYISLLLFSIMIVAAGCSNDKEQADPETEATQPEQEEHAGHQHDDEQENHHEAEENHQHEAGDDHHAAEETHHHDSPLHIDFQALNSIKANENTTLSVQIANEAEPLTEARVRFEIWQENSQAHDYVDATEETAGSYTATHTFVTAGTYHITIHVEKDQGHIHDHVETTVDVTE